MTPEAQQLINREYVQISGIEQGSKLITPAKQATNNFYLT
jgi:hypothetical protein